MNKTDNRHYNNTAANRSLNHELDLWIKFKNNNESPILLGVAISKPTKGSYGARYEMFYSPSELYKENPFMVRSEVGVSDYCVRSGSIKQAKYRLKQHDSMAKWKMDVNKGG